MFCKKCGAKVGSPDSSGKLKTNKMKWLIMGGALAIVIVAGVLFFIFSQRNNSVSTFKNAIQDNKYGEAIEVYVNEIKGDLNKETEVVAFLQAEIGQIKQDFINKKADFNAAASRLEAIKKTNLLTAEVSAAQAEMNDLNDSRVAFKSGEELMQNQNMKGAIMEFTKVIDSDPQYDQAQELIRKASSDYQAAVLSDAQQLASEQQFEHAISAINDALDIMPNDSELAAKKSVYENQNKEKLAVERKEKVEELKANQELSVVETRIVDDYIFDQMAQVIVQNNTDKVVKKYRIGYMGFDKDNYPVKFGLLNESFLREGVAEATIQPGEKHGSNKKWELFESKIVKIIACVKNVEYFDGSTWVNEYYDYWVEDHKDKPLQP
nr:DUF5780 domain-containing protein [Paenibacillus fonticola]